MRGLASSLLSLLTQAMIAECFRAVKSLSLSRSRAGSRPGPGHSHVSQDKTIGGSSIAPVGRVPLLDRTSQLAPPER